MPEPAQQHMTSDEFIAWAMEQPETKHYELFDGERLAMAPERSAHALTTFHISRRLADLVEAAKLPCVVYPDGMAVEIDDHSVYELDSLARCGPALGRDAIKLSDPLIVVEVLSPSTSARDVGAKPVGYFQLPSLRHCLIVRYESSTIVHHGRGDDGVIVTRIVRDGPILLDPPGITLTDCFPSGVA